MRILYALCPTKYTNFVSIGPGTTPDSVKHCLESLRRFLSPYYAVVGVDSKTLRNEPWASKTSLLVFPGGADIPVCRELNGETNLIIKDYIRKGGKYLGFCAGGYYGSGRCEFAVGDPQLEVSGPRELKLFQGTCRGPAFSGFQYGEESGSRVAELKINKTALNVDLDICYNYYNGGGVFVDAEKFDNVDVLASYTEQLAVEAGPATAAAVHVKVGKGSAILTGTHPEWVPEILKQDKDDAKYADIIQKLNETNESRQVFLRACLQKFGLTVNDSEVVRPRLTPLMFSSPITGQVSSIIEAIVTNVGLEGESKDLIKGNNDTIRLHQGEEPTVLHQLDKQEEFEDPDTAIKELYAFTDSLPERRWTPYFDIRQYFRYLQERHGSLTKNTPGATLIYGEVVTSTSSLLDKNFNILKHIPSGTVCSATVQVSGRGRGGNLWINPPGVVASSLVLDLPIAYKHAPVVFIQYLTSLAVVEAVKSMGEGYEELPIRIKWPNDIYAIKPEYFGKTIDVDDIEPSYIKVSGILVNTNVLKGDYKVVIGTGVNLSNAAPTTSINSTIALLNEHRVKRGQSRLDPISAEQLMAGYMYYMGVLFQKFINEGFKPLLPLYYEHWLHTNQIVRLQDHGNARTKITGITDDWGMLIAEEVDRSDKPTGNKFQLQPDGNSFDMFKGLISKKTTI